MANGGDFTSNLGRVYGIYTGGFIGFVVIIGILEQLGVPNQALGYLFVAMTIAVYAGIGIISRTMQVSEYYVAGRKVPAFYNGMATAADWMSAASFIGMAGTLYSQGYTGLAFVLGWTGGYVLVAVLIAPYLRKFGAYTVPDFLGARYGGNIPRFLGVIVLFCCSFTYIVAQVYGTGIVTSRFLGISFEVAVFVGLAGILVCSMLGGMRAVTWTQVAQYIVLIVAYLVPVVILSTQRTGVPLPQIMYGSVLQDVSALEATKEAVQGAKAHIATPGDATAWVNFLALILCLMLGTASLPHVLMRYFTTPSVRDARKSVGWSLLFIFLLYFTAPAYAVFAKAEIYQNVLGADISSAAAIQALFDQATWLVTYGKLGLVKLCGATMDSAAAVPAIAESVFQACQAKGAAVLNFPNFAIDNDVIVIATPEIAGLPYVISGLVAAGGLAAALSTADGLLLAIANALSHDIYYRMIDQHASTARRLTIARILLVGVAALAAAVAISKPAGILAMVAWAFSLAAAGLFVPLTLGVWWKRTTGAGAIAGMITGFGVCAYYLVGTRYFPESFISMWRPEAVVAKMGELQAAVTAATDEAGKTAASAALTAFTTAEAKWWGINNISCALFGLPVSLVVTVVVSLLTPAPSKEMQDFIDNVRIPKGETLMAEK
jgi:cation/acetate symporter